MTIHKLKILPRYFDAVKRGDKKFECRVNDRDYRVGDQLWLKEWDMCFTGRIVRAVVKYILNDEQFTKPNHIIMSIEVINEA